MEEIKTLLKTADLSVSYECKPYYNMRKALYNDYSCESFNKLKMFCKTKNFSNDLIVSHVIAFTILFYYAQRLHINVINWYDLISFDEEQLKQMYNDTPELKQLICFSQWKKNIIKSRKSLDEIEKRSIKYYKSYPNIENELTELITFIKENDILNDIHLKYIL